MNQTEAAADSVKKVIPKTVEIMRFANLDHSVTFIALALGLAIVIIGYFFAGGKYNRTKLIFSIVVSTIVGILVLPLFFELGDMLNIMDSPLGATTLLILDVIFVAVVSAHAYEIVTVTAKEAHPD